MKFFYDTEFLDDGKSIEFISIGIVREDGLEYYAVNADMDYERIMNHPWLVSNVMSQLPDRGEWKPKNQIAIEVRDFLLSDGRPELWAWFASYDNVVLNQLFGRILDLPSGIPMFSNDLRSLIDWVGVKRLPEQKSGTHDALEDARHLKVRFEYVSGVIQMRSRPVVK